MFIVGIGVSHVAEITTLDENIHHTSRYLDPNNGEQNGYFSSKRSSFSIRVLHYGLGVQDNENNCTYHFSAQTQVSDTTMCM